MITWAQELGHPECPYIRRWVLDLKWFSLRLHHWLASDDQRHYHDHPWWYLSFVLKGRYWDQSPNITTERKPGSIHFYSATHQHTVRVGTGGCWSILVTGSEKRIWGFWVKGKFKKRNRYFYDFGHHPCDSTVDNADTKSHQEW